MGTLLAQDSTSYTTNNSTLAALATAPPAHVHPESDVTGLVSDLAGKASSSHAHTESDVTGLVSDLASKAASVHSHAQADVTGLVADLASKAATTHTHAAGDLTSGTIATARLGSGTADSTTFLRGDSTWLAPTASVNIKQAEIDFGTTPVAFAEFTIVDADVSATSQLIARLAYEAPTGKDLDELEMDALELICQPATGQFVLRAEGRDGYVADTFKINYLIG